MRSKTLPRVCADIAWAYFGKPDISVDELHDEMSHRNRDGLNIWDNAKASIEHLMQKKEIRPNGDPMEKVKKHFEALFATLEKRFPDFGELSLYEDPKAHDGGRHYAYCARNRDGSIEIAFAREAAYDLSDDHLIAMMAHEMGHAIDFAYGAKRLESDLGVKLSTDTERRADQIAEAVFGFAIRYDPKCAYTQSLTKGVYPRPEGLK